MTPRQTRSARPDRAALCLLWLVLLEILMGTYISTVGGKNSHGIDANAFLQAVHDIDYSVLSPDPDLAAAIVDRILDFSKIEARKLEITG